MLSTSIIVFVQKLNKVHEKKSVPASSQMVSKFRDSFCIYFLGNRKLLLQKHLRDIFFLIWAKENPKIWICKQFQGMEKPQTLLWSLENHKNILWHSWVSTVGFWQSLGLIVLEFFPSLNGSVIPSINKNRRLQNILFSINPFCGTQIVVFSKLVSI